MFKNLILVSIISIFCSSFKFSHCESHNYLVDKIQCVDALLVTINPKYQISNQKFRNIFKYFDLEKVQLLTKSDNEFFDNNEESNTYYNIYKIELNDNQKHEYQKYEKYLKKFDEILFVEPDRIGYLSSEPNDLYYQDNSMWGLNGTFGINAHAAWNYTTGSSSIRVGVIDSGIANHNDLNANLSVGYDFFNNNNITNDDISGHGTHVAGIIGACGNNSIGVTGVNWNVSLVPLQATISGRSMFESTVVTAINYATNLWGTENQIDILNLSGGDFGTWTSVRAAIQNFPGLFVWSVQNELLDVDSRVNLNGSFDLQNLISVSSIRSIGEIGYTSNYSSSNNNVSIYAPGGMILSTYLNNSYETLSGTSMAAPHVTGVAALLLSYHPHLTATQLKTIILNNSDTITIEIPDGEGDYVSQNVRKLNAYNSMLNAASYHSYGDSYLYYSPTKHKSLCACGNYQLESHVVSSGSTITRNGHLYAPCIGCNRLIDLGSTGALINSLTGLLVSDNGSYILENEIIVLADDDLESYFDGSLKFHYMEGEMV